jgi:hypothetical protein
MLAAFNSDNAKYQASLAVLDAHVLFSPIKAAAAREPADTGAKSMVEEHHLFPRAYLATQGLSERKPVNQVANFALLEWPDNMKVGAMPPSAYAPPLDASSGRMIDFTTRGRLNGGQCHMTRSSANAAGAWRAWSVRPGSDYVEGRPRRRWRRP